MNLRSLISVTALLSCSVGLHARQTEVINGYFPEWGVYATPTPFYVKNLDLSGNAGRLTHLSYAFATIVDGQCALADPWADVQMPFTSNQSVNGSYDSNSPTALHGNFNQLRELKQKYPHLKIVMSIGGGGVAAPFSAAAATSASRKTFVSSCVSMFIQGNFGAGVAATPGIFDGLDIDWEYPLAGDTSNLIALLKEFRKQLDAVRPGLTLTFDAPAGAWAYQNIDLPATAAELTFYNLMTYDYAGPWQNQTGFVSPLYHTGYDPDATNNVDASVKAYLQAGVPADKIVMGVPFYAYGWTVPDTSAHGQFVEGTAIDQGEPYYPFVTNLMTTMKEYRAEPGREPFLFDGKRFWTYEDQVSLTEKAQYVCANQLRGAMVWSLNDDLPDGGLLQALWYPIETCR